jgi:hypothetical protein|tara:strand:+ start:4635 stop:5072 length:438 start_codon:yes stop_codon:yes gene_type:complete
MATTTLTLGLTSDISSNPLDISVSMNVTTDGSTGVSESSGLARKSVGTAVVTLIDLTGEPVSLVDKKAVLYIKNCDGTFTDYVDVRFGDTDAEHARALRIYGGQFAVLPLLNDDNVSGGSTADGDVEVIAASADTLIEYALFYEA